ncbi:dihydroorotate dehydrogenase electron transfer subunit [Candidatus Peregrinibacteria bacterium]|nr:dihydroorotate dehydrogenase electron transfer subunit [Candidatus Peregrinibacteria bacterium]
MTHANLTELPVALKIKKVVDETPIIKTLYFHYALNSRPGQFVMVWLPGVDEKPMSISEDIGDGFAVTICARGDTTKKITELKEGDQLGIRGPYGTSYHFEQNENIVLIAGGYGAAPLYYTALEAAKLNCKIDFIISAHKKENLVFLDKLKKFKGLTLHVATHDGSVGIKGRGTDILKKIVEQKEIHRIMTCGPEMMMKAVCDIGDAKNINTQVSVERYMKCGFGVCGQCVLDPMGIRSCVSGPIMNSKVLKMLDEFGNYQRDENGNKIYFDNPSMK